MNSNKQLLTRAAVYVIVFVMISISYVNFTNEKDKGLKEDKPAVVETVSVKSVEAPEEDEDKTLNEIDLDEFEETETDEEVKEG